MGVKKITNYFTKGRSRVYFNKMSIILIPQINKMDGSRRSKDMILNYVEYFSYLINTNIIHYDMAINLWSDFFKLSYTYISPKDKKSKKAYPNLKILIKRLKNE